MHIAEYFYGSYNNHSARRERKLLLNKKELRKLEEAGKNPGFTIVPVRLFINEKDWQSWLSHWQKVKNNMISASR